jgi:3-phosphoshikimate 1-carboxyvinyltransferase
MQLTRPKHPLNFTVLLPISKSILNRELIIKHLAGDELSAAFTTLPADELANDSLVLYNALTSTQPEKNVQDAGTALRFLTAAATCSSTPVILSGTARLHERPMEWLLNALRQCGADIRCSGKEGFAPLHVYPSHMKGGEVVINASVSSQFVSALLMVAPRFENGLTLHLEGKEVSATYTQMTIDVMKRFGIQVESNGNRLHVSPQSYIANRPFSAERDWSAAAFWYLLAGVLPLERIRLQGLRFSSTQGDAQVATLAIQLGVQSVETHEGIELTRSVEPKTSFFTHNFTAVPDLVPALAVWCAVKRIPAVMEGVAHLRYKESDRIAALTTELQKAGVSIKCDNPDAFSLFEERNIIDHEISMQTYEDHRLAMSWSALTALFDRVNIHHPEVVSKSYPAFWQQLSGAGFLLNEL